MRCDIFQINTDSQTNREKKILCKSPYIPPSFRKKWHFPLQRFLETSTFELLILDDGQQCTNLILLESYGFWKLSSQSNRYTKYFWK